MNVVLISTSDVAAGRSEALDRLVRSVAQVASTRSDIPISLVLLLQNCAVSPPSQDLPSFVDVSAIPNQIPVSAARNRLLERARALIGPDTVVGFPDDDCWYPNGTLEYIQDQFSRFPRLDLWLCRYSFNPLSAASGMTSAPARVRDVIRQASANTIFVRGRLIGSGILFDEKLGLGTLIGGEDTEFALSAYRLGEQTMYLDAAVIGHRDKNPQLRAKYYRGGLMAVAAHGQRHGGILFELMRKIAVGGWLTLRGELTLAGYFGALAAGYGAWRTRHKPGNPDVSPPRGVAMRKRAL